MGLCTVYIFTVYIWLSCPEFHVAFIQWCMNHTGTVAASIQWRRNTAAMHAAMAATLILSLKEKTE